MSATAPPARGSAWKGALKFLVAAAVLVLVVRMVPWRDELSYSVDGRTTVATGEIDGDWKAAQIRFQLDPPEQLDALPAELRERSSADQPGVLQLTRSESLSWRPGMPRAFRDVDPTGLSIALLLATVGIFGTSLRWWRLLRASGCPMRLWPTVRLTYIGFFFNIVVPGLTGGDVVKAVMVARWHPERRAAAAMSVLVDRLLGVLVLVAIGAVAVLVLGERFPYPRAPILVGLAVGCAALLAYASPTLRRITGFERLLARLPFAATLRQIDDALVIAARSPRELAWASGFSLFNQCCVMGALIVLGRSFGEQGLEVANYVVVSAVGNLISAVPLTPGGVGVTETAYGQLFELQGGSFTLGFACAIAWRLCLVAVGLGGGLFLLTPEGRLSAAERAQLQARGTASP
jgi:uncharacterized protein (TIRG00374 family)